MTELVSLTPQLQTANWGWTIAMFLWLVGLSGMGFFLNFWIRQKNFVYVLTVSGILGTLLVASHLARMLNLPIALFSALSAGSFNTQSWMLIGIVLLSVLCIGAVFYSLICAGILFKGEMWQKMAKSSWFNFIFAALGVLCTIYSGFLLTQAVGIPFWNTALIPLLWIMSGLASAIGCIELLMVFKLINPNTVGWSRRTALWVEIAELHNFCLPPRCARFSFDRCTRRCRKSYQRTSVNYVLVRCDYLWLCNSIAFESGD